MSFIIYQSVDFSSFNLENFQVLGAQTDVFKRLANNLKPKYKSVYNNIKASKVSHLRNWKRQM